MKATVYEIYGRVPSNEYLKEWYDTGYYFFCRADASRYAMAMKMYKPFDEYKVEEKKIEN